MRKILGLTLIICVGVFFPSFVFAVPIGQHGSIGGWDTDVWHDVDFHDNSIKNLAGVGIGTNTAPVVRTATVVVAAADAATAAKAQADYVCDGTDDQVEIQAAIDSLPASGGKVVLSEGTYIVNDTIYVPSNTTIAGYGYNSLIFLAAGVNKPVLEVGDGAYDAKSSSLTENVVITRLRVNGNVAQNPTLAFGIYLNYVRNVLVDSCYVEDTHDDGIIVSYDSDRVGIVNNRVSNASSGITIDRGSNNSFVVGNVVSDNTFYGVTLYNTDKIVIKDNISNEICVEYSRDILIAGNVIVGGDEGVFLTYKAGVYNERITIMDNLIEAVTYRGIFVDDGACPAGLIIVGNSIYNPGLHGIRVNVNNKHLIVSGNYVREAGGNGIDVRSSTAILLGNRIEYSQNHGIYAYDNMHGIIAYNFLYNQSQANDNTYDGILLNDVNDARIIGNTVFDDGTNRSRYGINEAGGSSADNNIIAFNRCVGQRTLTINRQGANTRIKDNLGYTTENSGTATITSGTTSVSVTHSLDSATPATVQVSPIEDIGNASYWYVSNIGATTFDINLSADPGKDVDFHWYASNGD